MNTTCQQVLGPRKHEHKELISSCSLNKIKERKDKKAILNNSKTRAGKIKAQEEYTTANKHAKKSIREDRRKFIDNLAEEAEQACKEGKMKKLYDTTKMLSGRYNNPERPVRTKKVIK